jgi:hypothetical protein
VSGLGADFLVFDGCFVIGCFAGEIGVEAGCDGATEEDGEPELDELFNFKVIFSFGVASV